MNADSAIAARIAALRAAAVAARHRRLLLLAGGDAWLAHVVALAATQLPGLGHASGHFRGQLGGEHGSLLFDARPGFDADAFGALAGTLRAGSLLLLLTPPLAAWPALPDAALARWLTAPATPADAAGRYLARLVGLLRADPDVLR
ncbi:MAG TPA: tRNA(Met) cytidine acetyltransferase TmcA domain-containing protein, partial [Gammaproteobacteria bacterium]